MAIATIVNGHNHTYDEKGSQEQTSISNNHRHSINRDNTGVAISIAPTDGTDNDHAHGIEPVAEK
jgi:hypothetical protein